jgi:hypothetical protein
MGMLKDTLIAGGVIAAGAYSVHELAKDRTTVINQPAPTPPPASEMPVSQPRPGLMGRLFGFRP